LLLLGNHRAHRLRQLKSPESFFKMRLAIVISPITWSRSASSAFSRSIVLASSDRAPRPVSASLPPLRNSSRHRYSVCSDIPARRAICTAGSSLLNRRNTIWARCSALNVDFFPISPLLLRNTTSITDLRVQRNRSYTPVLPRPLVAGTHPLSARELEKRQVQPMGCPVLAPCKRVPSHFDSVLALATIPFDETGNRLGLPSRVRHASCCIRRQARTLFRAATQLLHPPAPDQRRAPRTSTRHRPNRRARETPRS